MAGIDRQTGAFALAAAVAAGGILALGADGALASYAGGAALCACALLAGGRARMPSAFWLGLGTLGWLTVRTMGAETVGAETVGANWWVAGPELAAMAGVAGAFAVGVQCGAEPERARRGALVLTILLAALAVLAFAGHVVSPDAVLGRPKPYHAGRLTGTFLSANTAATVCAAGLALGLAGLARAARGAGGVLRALEAVGRRGLAPGTLTVFAGACLLLTGSRGGILAGLCGAAVVLAPPGGLRGVRLPALAGAGAVVVLAFAASGSVLGDRVADLGAGTSGRGALWSASLDAWREAPVFGHGLGTFARALAPHVTAETAPVLATQGAAHDFVLQWLVQTGLVGTAMGAATLTALGVALARGLRRRRGRWIVRAGLGALVVFVLHGLVDYAFEVPAATWALAMLCGLGCGVAGGAGGAGAVRDRRSAPR